MLGPVTMLVNCAGYAVAQKFEDTEIDDFKVSIFVYQWKVHRKFSDIKTNITLIVKVIYLQ